MAGLFPRLSRRWARPAGGAALALAGVAAGGVMYSCVCTPDEASGAGQPSLCQGSAPGSRRRRSRNAVNLSALQVQQYLEEGYLVVRGLFSRDEIQVLRNDLDALCRGRYDAADGSLVIRPEGSTPASGARDVLRILHPHNVSPICLHMATGHEAVQSILEQLVGAHLGPWWEGGVKMMQTMMFVRPLATARETWHQDEFYIPTRDRSLTAMWLPLEDRVDEDSGCLWVIPGSHRSGYIHSMGKEECSGVTTALRVPVERAVPLRMEAGDAVFFNGYTLHASLKAPARATRRAFAVHYCSGSSLLPWNLPGVGSGTGDNRRIVTVTGTDPYAADRPVYVPAVRKAYLEATSDLLPDEDGQQEE